MQPDQNLCSSSVNYVVHYDSFSVVVYYFLSTITVVTIIVLPASVAQLNAPSDWRPGGHGFNPRRGRQHSFVEIDHEIFSMIILSLPLIQEGFWRKNEHNTG